MSNIMLDIETLGNEKDACIIEIGAVEFNYKGLIDNEFHYYVDWDDSLKHGSVNGNTIKWWIQQSSEAKTNIIDNKGISLKSALKQFIDWFPKDACVWGNGSSFDISIMEFAFKSCSLDIPWKYNKPRDVRTIVDIVNPYMTKNDFENIGVEHNALDDAKYQAIYVSEMLKHIKIALLEYDENINSFHHRWKNMDKEEKMKHIRSNNIQNICWQREQQEYVIVGIHEVYSTLVLMVQDNNNNTLHTETLSNFVTSFTPKIIKKNSL